MGLIEATKTSRQGNEVVGGATVQGMLYVANPVPRIVGPIRHVRPVMARDVAFARARTNRPLKITVPGPFTMTQQAQNDY